MNSLNQAILLFSGYYGYTVGVKNKWGFKHLTLIIEVISSLIIAYYYTPIFIALILFNALYDITAFKVETQFWEKIDIIKKRRVSSYY